MNPNERLRELNGELEKNRMVGLKTPAHHTTGDWDFLNNNWALDNVLFVSPPSSLKFTVAANRTTIKPTTVPIANLKEGRIIMWIRGILANADTSIIFRYQDALNGYYLYARTAADSRLYRYLGGVNTQLSASGINWLPINTWVRMRLTWWNDAVGLVVRSEYWTAGAWAQIMPDGYDAPNHWKDIGGPIGMGNYGSGNNSNLFRYDDTYIYGIP